MGGPAAIVQQAVAALESALIDVFAVSPTLRSAAIGPSRRCYANAAAIIATDLAPPALLALLQSIEAHFGRRRRGQPWQARTLDLDIILWSGGLWCSGKPQLSIPHHAFAKRDFVLGPARHIAPDWRDPLSNLNVQHIFHRLNRPKPLDAPEKRL